LTTTSSTVNSEVRRSSSRSRPSKKDRDIELPPAIKIPISHYREIHSRTDSSDRIMSDTEDLEIALDRVKVETTWEVMTKYIDNEDDEDRPQHKANVFAK